MSDYFDMNEVDANLEKIAELYANDTLFHRFKIMRQGLKAPRDSREYKAAMIEVQRLTAPIVAILLPLTLVAFVAIMSINAGVDDRIIVTQMIEADEVPDLDEIEEFEPPEDFEIQDIDVDIPTIGDTAAPVDTAISDDSGPVSPQPQPFDAVLTVVSPVIMKNILGSTRDTGTRGRLMGRYGGDAATEAAVLRALRWLKKNQEADGSWRNQRIAMTGLAILTFLAHGEKPGDSVEFGDTVRKAIEYLISKQGSDGRFSGMDGNQYAHPIATYALCEAYGMTLNPNVKDTAERALVPIIKGQHPTGGWTYKMDPNPNANGVYRDDTSYMGWCAQALKAAHMAKLNAPGLEKAMKLSIKGFKANAHPEGGFGYVSRGKGGLTSVGSLCMQLLGASADNDVKRALALINEWVPAFQDFAKARALAGGTSALEWDQIQDRSKLPKGKSISQGDAVNVLRGASDAAEKIFLGTCAQYYYYYATQSKFHEGGRAWDRWNREMKPRYIKAQQIQRKAIADPKGKMQDIGWWENVDQHGDRPVMDTCLAALQLMVYYRYLPTTSAEATKFEIEVLATPEDPDEIVIDVGNI